MTWSAGCVADRHRFRPALVSAHHCHASAPDGVAIEVVSAVLGHASIHDAGVYGHLTSEDAAGIEAAGWFAGGGCRGDRTLPIPFSPCRGCSAGSCRRSGRSSGRRVRLRPDDQCSAELSPGSQLPGQAARLGYAQLIMTGGSPREAHWTPLQGHRPSVAQAGPAGLLPGAGLRPGSPAGVSFRMLSPERAAGRDCRSGWPQCP